MTYPAPKRHKTDRKNSRLLHFLETDHGLLLRFNVCISAACGVFLITGSPTLAKDAATQAMKPHNFKRTFRLCSWYVKFGWMRWTYLLDSFFTVSEGMDAKTLQSLLAFWDSRNAKIATQDYDLEKLCITGALLDTQTQVGTVMLDAFKKSAKILIEKEKSLSDSCTPLPKTAPKRKTAHDFDVKNAIIALTDFTELVPQDTYRWFVMAGTFLGLYREQQFLPYELDIDLGLIWDADSHTTLVELLQGSAHFNLQKIESQYWTDTQGSDQAQVVLIKLIHRSGISFDIFYHMTDGDQLWHGSALYRWENSPFTLTPYDLHNITVLGPKDGAQYLTESYGDWETPISNFDYNIQMPNLTWAPNYKGIAHTVKRLHMLRTKNTTLYATVLKRLQATPLLEL